MGKLAMMILTITISSLFFLSLARTIDLPPSSKITDESNTSLSLEVSNLNRSTDLEISEPVKQEVEEDEEDKQVNTMSLLDKFPNRLVAMLDEPDPDIIIGWDPKEDVEEEPKEEKVTKKKTKRSDESNSDSDSDSDDEEGEKEIGKKNKKSKNGKKGGLLRWFWKLINRFD